MMIRDNPIFMIGFTPRGACRAETRCSWPAGTAYTFNLKGEMVVAARDLEGRGWSIEQFARHQCGIASRQLTSVSFACDSKDDIDTIARIVETEFPDLVPDWRHPGGRAEYHPGG
jgi:hypothetical protein